MKSLVSGALYLLFGKAPDGRFVTTFFSTRLDETGTDGHSPYAIVAGGISRPEHWDELEHLWGRLMKNRGVELFHTREFDAGDGDFAKWGKLKKSNFVRSMQKIVDKTVEFQIAVAVERETHTKIKTEMRGIRGFNPDSDVGLCFRIARFLICDKIATIFPDARVQFIVEDGPYAAGAAAIYQEIKKTKGAIYRPARYAEMMTGFASVPKGELRSLEAADYLAGRGIADLQIGRFTRPGRQNQISLLAGPDFLRAWHEDMLKEKEHRHKHGHRNVKKASSSKEQSS